MRKDFFWAAGLFCVTLSACNKMTSNPYYGSGATPKLSSTVTSIAAAPADSLNNAVVFSWTDPQYPTPFPGPAQYVLQIDSAGKGFKAPVTFTLSGTLADSMTAGQVNTMVLAMGGSFGVPYAIEARVVSSYANNNDALNSNTLTIQITPYKTPPKVPPPAQLFIIGDATQETPQWTNSPLLAPIQQFTKIDSVTFGGIFNLTAGGGYVFLPVDNGDWDTKYGVGASWGGALLVNGAVPGSNSPAPDTTGLYEIIVNFQTAIVTVTPYTGIPVPDSLFIIGDATPENPQWTNSFLLTTQGQVFTRLDNASFSITLNLTSGGYVFLPVDNGDWTNKYGGVGATGGALLYDGAVPGSNTPGPAASGKYTVLVNFITPSYTVTAQ